MSQVETEFERFFVILGNPQPVANKMAEFREKLPTAFDPPPNGYIARNLWLYSQELCSQILLDIYLVAI